MRSINLVWFQRYVFDSIRTFEPRFKRFNTGYAKCIELSRFSNHFVRMTVVCKIRAENGGIFPSHLDSSLNYIELGWIRGFELRLAIEVKFDWYSSENLVWFQRYVFESIRTFELRSKRFNIECVKCIELARFSHHFVRMTLVWQIRAENEGIFPSHLDSS
jgi:hypothetical protein